MFDDSFDLGMDASPPEPPWDQIPTSLFSDLQVKSEPVSPASSHSSDSSALSMTPDPLRQVASPDAVIGVKAEHPATPPCMFGDVLAPPVSTVQISLMPAPETQAAPGNQRGLWEEILLTPGLASRGPGRGKSLVVGEGLW
nr:cyclic AMP-dependent transcription factor ATF-6 beta-like [Pelodiscus sinensis]|eukprot:XP_025046830.1 cyclic AMP-dependent transcription factor ATF-6 beta-like [Pelodiscus sinensis]